VTRQRMFERGDRDSSDQQRDAVPQNETLDARESRHAGRKGNWRQLLRDELGVPHSRRLSTAPAVFI
jgi:hypothetical protein